MILLGLGSNVGKKSANLRAAMAQFNSRGIRLLRCSGFYTTPPWGIEEQPAFVNAVCEVVFSGSAGALLTALLEIEQSMGREREQKWGPRLIDLDILEFQREVHQTEFLQLPHPFYPERAFVLFPLLELEPYWIPTGGRIPARQLLANLGEQEIHLIEEG
jgi:2-amino-4-hydroxy-6-hydroxymethyldihydropteridine diphosphokinase